LLITPAATAASSAFTPESACLRLRHASQGDSLTQHAIPDPELQASRRSHLSEDTKPVLNAKGESRHVQIAVTSVHIDKQIEVAARGCFPTRH
jgi:hypothetical protein